MSSFETDIKELDEKELESKNYDLALKHWKLTNSDVNGMLGGFDKLHLPDINGSKQFLCELRKKKILTHFDRALDCGSGIGRVTKHLLLPAFQSVHLVDFADCHIQQSYSYIQQPSTSNHVVGNRFVESLHTFVPEAGYYDLIWIQWVTGHLQSDHFVQFLKRCKDGTMSRKGCIVIKDNIATGPEDEFDQRDCSWTRTRGALEEIFEKAGCRVVLERRQLHFPKQLYEVRMFALKPVDEDELRNENAVR